MAKLHPETVAAYQTAVEALARFTEVFSSHEDPVNTSELELLADEYHDIGRDLGTCDNAGWATSDSRLMMDIYDMRLAEEEDNATSTQSA